jgi:hypothetical protein
VTGGEASLGASVTPASGGLVIRTSVTTPDGQLRPRHAHADRDNVPRFKRIITVQLIDVESKSRCRMLVARGKAEENMSHLGRNYGGVC